MDYENRLCGKNLIEATVKIVKSKTDYSEDIIRAYAQDLYADHECFDGEPTDPIWFANKVIDRINKKTK